MHRWSFLAASAALVTTLACGSGKTRPPPAPNAGECSTWQGVAIPLDEGVIVDCSKNAVAINHEDAAAARWKYHAKFVAGGWPSADPNNAVPAVAKGPNRIEFDAEGDNVVLHLKR